MFDSYITYHTTDQRLLQSSDGSVENYYEDFEDLTANSEEPIPAPDDMPLNLICVDEWKLVPGSSVKSHYWALSYSWNQSGDSVKGADGKYERIDNGKHKIVTHPVTRRYQAPAGYPNEGYKNMYEVDLATKSTQDVKFETLIRRMCTDFGIRYIWYDQMCINQADHSEKMREIKRMHIIYRNASCTLALVPELRVIGQEGRNMSNFDVISKSQWASRMWTLEEAHVSKQLLLVGRNLHMWLPIPNAPLFMLRLFYPPFLVSFFANQTWRACTTLLHARKRTSTKDHDRVFALVNIHPNLKDDIPFSYNQPISDLMIKFYGLLAQSDPSILYFGAPVAETEASEEIMAARRRDACMLPSWTGTAGAHIPDHALVTADNYNSSYDHEDDGEDDNEEDGEDDNGDDSKDDADDDHEDDGEDTRRYVFKEQSCPYTVNGAFISMTCTLIPVSIEVPSSATYDTVEQAGVALWRGLDPGSLRLNPMPQRSALTFMTTMPHEAQTMFDGILRSCELKATHFLLVSIESDDVIVSITSAADTTSKQAGLSALLSLTEECSECFILSDISFYISYMYMGEEGEQGSDYICTCHPVITKKDEHYKSIGLSVFLGSYSFDPSIELKESILIK